MKALKDVDYNGLKQACKSLNEAKILEEDIKFIGVKKEKLLETFNAAIETIIETTPEDVQESIPDFVIDFYNDLISDEVTEEPEEDKLTDETQPVPEDEVQAEETVVEQTEPEPEVKKKRKGKDYDAPEPMKKKLGQAGVKIGTKRWISFEEYSSSLRTDGPETPTNYLDLIFLDGATLQEAVDLFKAFLEENNMNHKGYRSVGLINDHIKARAERSGFIFSKDGDTFTLVGAIE